MKRFLLGCLLVLPLLAQADPLNNGALAVLTYAALALVALVALTLLLLVLAFLFPQRKGLQIVQGVFLVLFALFYLLGERLLHFLGNPVNTTLSALLPLGLLLNGLTQARQARGLLACRVWAGVAVIGCTGLLWILVALLHLDQLWQPDLSSIAWRTLWHLSLALPVDIGGWLLVLLLLRRHLLPATALWQPWWAAPASAAGITAVYYVFNTLRVFLMPNVSPDLVALLPSILVTAGTCWLAGVAMLRLVHPLAHPQSEIMG